MGTEVACVCILSSRDIAGLDSRSAEVKSALDTLASAERFCIRNTPANAANFWFRTLIQINNLSLLRRHRVPAAQYRAARTQAFQVWAEVTGVTASAQP